jgi:hypothetical protein
MSESELPEKVRMALGKEVNEISLIEIRAAAYLLIVLCEPGIWPPISIEEDLKLGIQALSNCIDFEKNDTFARLMTEEREVLRDKLQQRYRPDCVPAIHKVLKLWFASGKLTFED